MTDEKQEEKPSFLEELRVEKASLEKVRDENKQLVERMERIKAEQIMQGTADTGQTPVKPKEETDEEYAKRFMSGGIPLR